MKNEKIEGGGKIVNEPQPFSRRQKKIEFA